MDEEKKNILPSRDIKILRYAMNLIGFSDVRIAKTQLRVEIRFSKNLFVYHYNIYIARGRFVDYKRIPSRHTCAGICALTLCCLTYSISV